MAKQQNIPVEPITEVNTPDTNINQIINNWLDKYKINIRTAAGFTLMLKIIADEYKSNIDISDIHQLERMFIVYLYLCSLCDFNPNMIGFSVFVNVNYNTLKDWKAGRTRTETHTSSIQKMYRVCESSILQDIDKGSITSMFKAKSMYGYTEQPKQQITQNNLFINSPEQSNEVLRQFGILSDNTKSINKQDNK